MVLANNVIRLSELQAHNDDDDDHAIFTNLSQVSLTTLAHILKKQKFPI